MYKKLITTEISLLIITTHIFTIFCYLSRPFSQRLCYLLCIILSETITILSQCLHMYEKEVSLNHRTTPLAHRKYYHYALSETLLMLICRAAQYLSAATMFTMKANISWHSIPFIKFILLDYAAPLYIYIAAIAPPQKQNEEKWKNKIESRGRKRRRIVYMENVHPYGCSSVQTHIYIVLICALFHAMIAIE